MLITTPPLLGEWQSYLIAFVVFVVFHTRILGFLADELTKFIDKQTKLFRSIKKWIDSYKKL